MKEYSKTKEYLSKIGLIFEKQNKYRRKALYVQPLSCGYVYSAVI